MPYPPGYGYLTDRGTLFYNGKIPNPSFIGRAPYMCGAALEVDWKGRILWEVQHPDHTHDGIRCAMGISFSSARSHFRTRSFRSSAAAVPGPKSTKAR
jgi:hypothetical protein